MAELKSNVVEISGGVGKVASTAFESNAGKELIMNVPKNVTVISKPAKFSGRSIARKRQPKMTADKIAQRRMVW